MKVSKLTITALQKVITGDEIEEGRSLGSYPSGPELIDFFNQFGFDEVYAQGFPSRWFYTETKLVELNGSEQFPLVVEQALDPRHYIGTKFNLNDAAQYLTEFLELDGFQLRKVGKTYVIQKVGVDTISFDHAFTESGKTNIDFINEQISKCTEKMNSCDYDGAITNARSFLEAVLLEIENKISGVSSKYNGDLPKLYKRVQKLINLEPDRKDIADSLKQVLRGFVNIVNGLAPLRNKMSDAHVREHRPQMHHAKLVINSVCTVATFFLESIEYQVEKGLIKSKKIEHR